MSIILNINGVGYQFPEEGDETWGTDVTDWAQAVTNGMLQKAGGEFTLTNEVNFGGGHGIKSLYLKSTAEDAASTGRLRLGHADKIAFRNAGDSNDILVGVDADNDLTVNGEKLDKAPKESTIEITSTITNSTELGPIELESTASRFKLGFRLKQNRLSSRIRVTQSGSAPKVMSTVQMTVNSAGWSNPIRQRISVPAPDDTGSLFEVSIPASAFDTIIDFGAPQANVSLSVEVSIVNSTEEYSLELFQLTMYLREEF